MSFFFFKQKTAYEMRISDWSSDVCSSDLSLAINGEMRQSGHTGLMLFPTFELIAHISRHFTLEPGDLVFTGTPAGVGPLHSGDQLLKLGRASCRDRVCQYV